MDAGILVPLTLFGGTAAVLWKYFEGRHKERMAMIDKGVTPAEFKSINPIINPLRIIHGNVLSNLKWGLLFVFVGAGFLVGEQLQYYFSFHEESAIFGCMLVTGGLALIIFYIIAAKKLKDNKSDEK
jgi:hypothetical protein